MDDLRSGSRGDLSLGVNESSIHALLPVLARYRRRYPDVRLAVRRTFSRDIPAELLNYRLDLGVVSFVPREPQLAAVKIFRDELTFVVSPEHKLAKRRQVDIADLGAEVFIAHIVESPFRSSVIQLFAKHHVPLEMRVEMPTIESIKRFVQMDMGVAIVPRMCVRWEAGSGIAGGSEDSPVAHAARPLSALSPPRPAFPCRHRHAAPKAGTTGKGAGGIANDPVNPSEKPAALGTRGNER